jgi:PadR family transcriptional regulator, regulatory protein AphA
VHYGRAVPSSPLTPTSYVVLGLTALLGPATPYEMEQWVESSLGHFWSFPRSQLYSEPARLVAAGLLEEEREEGGRRRRRFSLLPPGREALQAWLAEPDGRTSEIRDLGLLRLFFGSQAADPADVVVNARAQAAAHAAQLQVYKDLQQLEGMEPHVAATLRLGAAYESGAVAFWESLAAEGP